MALTVPTSSGDLKDFEIAFEVYSNADGKIPKIMDIKKAALVINNNLAASSNISLAAFGQTEVTKDTRLTSAIQMLPPVNKNPGFIKIKGSFISTNKVPDLYATVPVINNGVLANIPGSFGTSSPSAELLTDFESFYNLLKSLIDLTDIDSVILKISRIKYLSVVFGSGGYSFPSAF